MPKFYIKSDFGFYNDFVLGSFVPSKEEAQTFDTVKDAIGTIHGLNKDGVPNVKLITEDDKEVVAFIDKEEESGVMKLLEVARRFAERAEADAVANPTSDSIQVVIVEPMKKPYKKTIPNTLEEMQKIVGGYIENVTIDRTSKGASVGIVLNEEGKLLGLPFNRRIMNFDILVGTFFITAYNMTGDNISLSDDECEKYIRRFSTTEVYV